MVMKVIEFWGWSKVFWQISVAHNDLVIRTVSLSDIKELLENFLCLIRSGKIWALKVSIFVLLSIFQYVSD